MTTKKLKAVLIALAGVGVLFNAHAYQGMKSKTDGDITKPGNWTLNPAYVDLSVSSAKVDGSWDANWGALPGEDLFLGADIVANRLMYDAGKRTTTVDLRGHTLTLISRSGSPSIAFSAASSGSTLTFTNGNVMIPTSPYQGQTLSMPYVELARNNGGTGLPTGTTLTVGENAILTAPKILFYQGTNLTLNVKDGGKIVSDVQFGESGGVGLTFRIDNGTYQHTGGDASLSIGNSATAISNTLVLAGNWKTEGFTSPRSFPIGAVAGARGSRLVVESNAVVTIDDQPTIPSTTCADCGITVQAGGKLYFENETAPGKGRFWLGAASNSADILVTGEGSYLETKSSNPAFVGYNCGKSVVRVTDGAVAKFANVKICAYNGCSDNRMVVDHAGELQLNSIDIGGHNAQAVDDGKRAVSNVLEVVDGGKLTLANGSISVGALPYAYRSGLRVVGENSVVSGVQNVILNGTGYENTGFGNVGEQWMEVRDGGKVTIANYLRTVARNCRIYLEGCEVSCAVAMLTNGVSLVVGCQKDRMPSKPLLKATGSVYLGAHNYNTKLGKDAVTISMSDGSTIADDGELVVIEAADLKVDPEVVAAFNATLPEGFKARVRDNRLTVSREKGLCLIFR